MRLALIPALLLAAASVCRADDSGEQALKQLSDSFDKTAGQSGKQLLANPSEVAPVVTGQPLPPAPAAGGCGYVRMDDPGGSMENVHPRDQGPYGICYAETATQLADAWRFTHGDTDYGRQTAVMSAAIGLADMNAGKDPFNGGWSCNVVDFLRQDGGHDDFKVKECIVRADKNDPNAVDRLGSIYDSYIKELSAKIAENGGNPVSSTTVQNLRNAFAEVVRQDPGLGAGSLPSKVLPDFFGYKRERFIAAIGSYDCFNKDPARPLDLPACVKDIDPHRAASDYRAIVDQRLALPAAQPVEISYCATLLQQGPSYPGVNRDPAAASRCAPQANGKPGGSHSSLIIGRRTAADGTCQYLVRNSWGASCKGGKRHTLPGGPEVAPGYGSGKDIYSPAWNCDEGKGDIWIPADALFSAVFGVSYLDAGTP